MNSDSAQRIARARMALEGLSVGDAFGEQFFSLSVHQTQPPEQCVLKDPPWPWTDDTDMALSVFSVLRPKGSIEQELLADDFLKHFEMSRGYGPSLNRILRTAKSGREVIEACAGQFGGAGSYGNGAAMRAAPVGAYFADDLKLVI